MPTTATLEPGPETAAAAGNGAGPRRPSPRRSLPSARAALGGLLITLAALGAVVVARGGDPGPDRSYLVAVDDLVPGQPIHPSAVELQPLTLSPQVSRAAFTELDELEAATPAAPILAGELLQRGDIEVPGSADAGHDQVSLSIPRARGLNGDLRVGDRVDVLATYGSGETATTEVVAVGALVIGAESGSDAVGATGEVVVTLSLDSPRTVLATAHAGAAAEVTLARSSAGGAAPGTEVYRGTRTTTP